MSQRISVTISGDALDQLESIATERHVSKAEVLRGALALESLYVKTKRNHGELLIEQNGKLHQIERI